MSRPDSVQQLATELATAMLPLEVILQHDDVLRRFLRNQLGYAIPDTVTTIGVDPATVQAVIDAFAGLGEALAEDAPDDTRALAAWTAIVVAVTAAARDIFAGPNALTGQVDAAFLAASRVIETLPRRLLDWLILERLEASAPALHSLLVVLGIAETTPIAADASTYTTAHQRRILHYERVGRVLSDPVGLFGEVYGWGAPDARLDELLLRLSGLGTTLGVLTRFGSPSTDLQARLYEPAGPEATPEDAPLPQLRLPLVGDGNAGAGLSLVVVPRITAEGTPGIALMPFAGGGSTTNIALDDRRRWFLSIKGSFDATAGIAVVVRPGRPLRGIVDPGGTGTTASGHVTFELRRRDPTGDPFSIARFGETTRLSATELILGAGVVVGAADDELFLEIGVHGGELQLALTDADSFVREILPDGIRARLDLTLGFSSRRGAYFQGGAGLELTQPLHASVGPVSLDSITIALAPGDETLELSLGVTAALRLGPVTATIGRVGTAIRAAAPDGGGNLGPLDLVIRVKPPDGVGLSIEAGPVTGGGFLSYDAEQQQYAGAVRLEVERLTLGAIGLLTTRLPGGADGYSLVLLVTSSGFAPVPLGYGFTLTGVGGLFGVNRTVAVEALRAGLRDHTLDAVLVSQTDPVPRAAQIVGTLRRVFPPAVGRYLFGPMAIIEWGTPTVLTLDLAVLLELPAPLRLVVG